MRWLAIAVSSYLFVQSPPVDLLLGTWGKPENRPRADRQMQKTAIERCFSELRSNGKTVSTEFCKSIPALQKKLSCLISEAYRPFPRQPDRRSATINSESNETYKPLSTHDATNSTLWGKILRKPPKNAEFFPRQSTSVNRRE